MCYRIPANRSGITLIEVMISIGILAVGLTSVLSLIPAGKSEVSKAIVFDRASALAANALADAATFGLLKPESLSLAGPGATMAVFDPATGASWPDLAWMKSAGIFSEPATAVLTSGTREPVLKLIAQGRDDVNYANPASEDDPPKNQFPAVGPRAFQGRMSCVIAVAGTTALTPGSFAKLSAIVFHNRDLSSGATLYASGTCDASSSAITFNMASLPPERTLREVVRPGTVIWTGTSFHQLSMAAIDESTMPPSVFVTFSGGAPAGGTTVRILLDSVGLAEQTVILEGPGPWSQ